LLSLYRGSYRIDYFINKEICEDTTNTFNTFNTFWKGVERNVSHKDKKSNRITKYNKGLNKIEVNSEKHNENSDKKPLYLLKIRL
jgi:hypothetical protein